MAPSRPRLPGLSQVAVLVSRVVSPVTAVHGTTPLYELKTTFSTATPGLRVAVRPLTLRGSSFGLAGLVVSVPFRPSTSTSTLSGQSQTRTWGPR